MTVTSPVASSGNSTITLPSLTSTVIGVSSKLTVNESLALFESYLSFPGNVTTTS